jgi:hypothetical protein
MDGTDAPYESLLKPKRVMRWKVALSFTGQAEILGLVSLFRVMLI